MPRTVLYFSPVGYFKGGAERSLFDLLANPEVTPVLVVPEEGAIAQKARSQGIRCHVLPFGMIEDIRRPFSFAKGLRTAQDLWRASTTLKRLAREEGADVVHSNGLKAHMINGVAYRLGGAKAVMHIRDIPYTRSEIVVWKLMRHLSSALVMVSRACWPEEGTLPSKVHVIHNGTPLVPESDTPARAEGQPLTLAFVGRIHPAKGLHLLLDWLASARAQGLDARLSIRGEFSQDAPDYEAQIQAQIARLVLSDVVSFTGFLNDPQRVYAGVDIVVVPSETPDPLPRSVMESMARGIPVLGYPAGGIGDMIVDGETGFLVRDAASFTRAIAAITQDKAALQKLTAQARAKIATEFTIPHLHHSLSALYSKL
jgi:glycosyltransferase involved in cell wall biosynthesis